MTNIQKEKMKSHLKAYKMKLTTLSPIFIGGGEDSTLGKTRYILDPTTQQIHILDETKWADFISGRNQLRKNLFDEYLDFMKRYSRQQKARKGQRPPQYQGGLYEWLYKKGFKHSHYRSCIKYSVDASKVDRGHDLHCFIKDIHLKPYIPGTSIKGTIRTAVLFKLIREKSRDQKAIYWNQVNRAMERGYKRDLKKIMSQIKQDMLYTVQYEGKKNRRKSAVNDIFRGLSVSDSKTVDPSHLTVLQKKDLSTYEKNNNHLKSLPLFREYLKTSVETDFTITLDNNIVKNTILEDLDSILKCLSDFTEYLIGEDKGIYSTFERFFNRYPNINYPDQGITEEEESYLYPNFCIGGGTGFPAKVIIYGLAPSKNEAIRAIRSFLEKSFRFHKHGSMDHIISPRTLKLVEFNNFLEMPGWCNIREVKSIC